MFARLFGKNTGQPSALPDRMENNPSNEEKKREYELCLKMGKRFKDNLKLAKNPVDRLERLETIAAWNTHCDKIHDALNEARKNSPR